MARDLRLISGGSFLHRIGTKTAFDLCRSSSDRVAKNLPVCFKGSGKHFILREV
jgi:hypothetical protein